MNWHISNESGMETHMTADLHHTATPGVPLLPASFSRIDLERAGFRGWRTWAELRRSDFASVPSGPVVYVICRSVKTEPSFLAASPGGHFKGKDPSVPVGVLRENWVVRAEVVYIGKADVARRRLGQYARFGAGERVGHWGGRFIWQLADSADMQVAWHAITWGETAPRLREAFTQPLRRAPQRRASVREPHWLRR
jgi:hypothetical protein